MKGDFRFDLEFGQSGEQYIKDILMQLPATVEVKTEREGEATGNHFLEFECSGKPSGIATTQATHWAVLLPTTKKFVILPIGVLKEIGRWFYYVAGTVSGGDNDAVRGVLIPLEEIFSPSDYDSSILKRTGCPF